MKGTVHPLLKNVDMNDNVAVWRAFEEAFKAGYHCQWIRSEHRYIFDPLMSPGDPDGAFAAWIDRLYEHLPNQ